VIAQKISENSKKTNNKITSCEDKSPAQSPKFISAFQSPADKDTQTLFGFCSAKKWLSNRIKEEIC
jgi:hypothetical protein